MTEHNQITENEQCRGMDSDALYPFGSPKRGFMAVMIITPLVTLLFLAVLDAHFKSDPLRDIARNVYKWSSDDRGFSVSSSREILSPSSMKKNFKQGKLISVNEFLDEKYISRKMKDPWGNDYKVNDATGTVLSAGEDGMFGTGDDIVMTYRVKK